MRLTAIVTVTTIKTGDNVRFKAGMDDRTYTVLEVIPASCEQWTRSIEGEIHQFEHIEPEFAVLDDWPHKLYVQPADIELAEGDA